MKWCVAGLSGAAKKAEATRLTPKTCRFNYVTPGGVTVTKVAAEERSGEAFRSIANLVRLFAVCIRPICRDAFVQRFFVA